MANAGHIIISNTARRSSSHQRPPAKSVSEWMLNKKNDSPVGQELAARKASWSREDGNRAGIEVTTQDLMKSAQGSGEELSYESARRQVVEIADRVDQKKRVSARGRKRK